MAVTLTDCRFTGNYDALQLWRDSHVQQIAPPHIMLKKRENDDELTAQMYGAASLYDYTINQYTIKQSQFTQYTARAIQFQLDIAVERLAKELEQQYNVKIGRVRINTLQSKRALTMHTDAESAIRFHVPLITNRDCMFIVEDETYKMPETGRVYTLDVTKRHTAINASREDRVHLVLDGYR